MASTTNPRVRAILCIVASLVLTLLLGALVVIAPMGVNVFVFLCWLVAVALMRRRRIGQGRAFLPFHAVTMAAIVVGAALAPVKTKDRILERTTKLPAARMRLRDFDSDRVTTREWFPMQVSLAIPESERDAVVVFPGETMTLREFVAAIEGQTSLRHQFSHCGNGSSILYGGDCCFGLRFRPVAKPPEGTDHETAGNQGD